MTPEIQTAVALSIVAIVLAWFAIRLNAKQKNPGCGGGCGCPSTDLKTKLKR